MKTPGPITLYCVEDEMITLHRGGVYFTTLYASCPEQANDFFKHRKTTRLATADEWCLALMNFQHTWKTKYPDDEY